MMVGILKYHEWHAFFSIATLEYCFVCKKEMINNPHFKHENAEYKEILVNDK